MFQDLLAAYAECTSLYEQFNEYQRQTERQLDHFAERMCRLKLRLEFLVLDMPEANMPLPATDGPRLRLSSPPVRLSSRPPTEAPISTPPSPAAAAVDAAPVPPAPAVEEHFYYDDNIAEWIAATDFSRLGNDMAVTSAEPPLKRRNASANANIAVQSPTHRSTKKGESCSVAHHLAVATYFVRCHIPFSLSCTFLSYL